MFTSITHSISPQNCSLPLTTHTTLKSHLPLFSNTPSISVFFQPFLFKLFHPLPDYISQTWKGVATAQKNLNHCVPTLIKNTLQPLPLRLCSLYPVFHIVTNVLPHSFILNTCRDTSCFRCRSQSHCSTIHCERILTKL